MKRKRRNEQPRKPLPTWRTEADFRHEFPEVDQAFIVYQEGGKGIPRDPSSIQWSGPGLDIWRTGGWFECPDEKCRNGGFDISSDIREMVRGTLTERESYKLCMGHSGRVSPSCLNLFRYRITMKYKADTTSGNG